MVHICVEANPNLKSIIVVLINEMAILAISAHRQFKDELCGVTCFSARLPMIRFHFSMGESIFPTFTCVGKWDKFEEEAKTRQFYKFS